MSSRISIFGLGYVGTVSAACFAAEGNHVVGVDPQEVKVEMINSGKAPVIEADLPDLIRDAVSEGRLRATMEAEEAIADTDVTVVCVGTPSQPNGSLDLSHVAQVCTEIGAALREKSGYHVVVIRSTVLPGTLRELVIPTLEEASGKTIGAEIGLSMNPEFLRESTAVKDFYNPPKTVVGAIDERSGKVVADLYAGIDAPLIITGIDVAEAVKYTDNAWHALKIAFANEIGNVCKSLDIDSHKVMDIFCQDTKLNLSPYYLKPGFAFGGSCLPKDVRALTYKARSLDLSVPVLDSIMPSNDRQVERALNMVTAKGFKRIGVLGFSFKAGTDDLRESPIVELIERLIGKGYELRLFDRNVNLARLMGANREYILKVIPHISRLMADGMQEVLDHGELIIIGNGDPDFHSVTQRLRPDQTVLDLVRVPEGEAIKERYDGINW